MLLKCDDDFSLNFVIHGVYKRKLKRDENGRLRNSVTGLL